MCVTSQRDTSPVPIATAPVPIGASPVPIDASPVPITTAPVPIDAAPVPMNAAPVPIAAAHVPIAAALVPIAPAPVPIDAAPVPIAAAPVPMNAPTVPMNALTVPMNTLTAIFHNKCHGLGIHSFRSNERLASQRDASRCLDLLAAYETARVIIDRPGTQEDEAPLPLPPHNTNQPTKSPRPQATPCGRFFENAIASATISNLLRLHQ